MPLASPTRAASSGTTHSIEPDPAAWLGPRLNGRIAVTANTLPVMRQDRAATPPWSQHAASRALGAVIDRLAEGIIVVAADGSVLFANRAAAALAARHGIRLGPASVGLTCAEPVLASRLAALVGRAAAGQEGGTLRVGTSLAMTIAPLSVSALRDGDQPDQLALVTLRDLVATSDAGQAPLIDLFGLTAAEAALVPQLLAGDSMAAIARSRGVAPATVRAQAAQVLAKTGAANLRALATMLGNL